MATEAGTAYGTFYDDLEDDATELRREYDDALAYANRNVADEIYEAREGNLDGKATSWLRNPNGPEARAIFDAFPQQETLPEWSDRREMADSLLNDLAATTHGARNVARYFEIDPEDHDAVVLTVQEAMSYAADGLVNGNEFQFRSGLDELRRTQHAIQRKIADHCDREGIDYGPETDREAVDAATAEFRSMLETTSPETAHFLENRATGTFGPERFLEGSTVAADHAQAIWSAYHEATQGLDDQNAQQCAEEIAQMVFRPTAEAAKAMLDVDFRPSSLQPGVAYPENFDAMAKLAAQNTLAYAHVESMRFADFLRYSDDDEFVTEAMAPRAAWSTENSVGQAANYTQWPMPELEARWQQLRRERDALIRADLYAELRAATGDAEPDYRNPEHVTFLERFCQGRPEGDQEAVLREAVINATRDVMFDEQDQRADEARRALAHLITQPERYGYAENATDQADADAILADIQSNYESVRDFLHDLREIGTDHGNEAYERLERLLDQVKPERVADVALALREAIIAQQEVQPGTTALLNNLHKVCCEYAEDPDEADHWAYPLESIRYLDWEGDENVPAQYRERIDEWSAKYGEHSPHVFYAADLMLDQINETWGDPDHMATREPYGSELELSRFFESIPRERIMDVASAMTAMNPAQQAEEANAIIRSAAREALRQGTRR